eukprot:2314890-Pyramimonas_sp.AAC.1
MVRDHQLRVEWQKVTEKYRSLLQRSARTSTPTGQDSEGRPYPWAASGRTVPTPPAPPDRTSYREQA